MERLINILIIDDNPTDVAALQEIISGFGNIILLSDSIENSYQIVSKKEIGIILVNIDSPLFTNLEDYSKLTDTFLNNSHYTIVITENTRAVTKILRGFNHGAVDFIQKPFNPYLIQAKIEVFKKLYFKDIRIAQLLGNIFPSNILNEFNQQGRFTPRRIDNGVVLFTDFVDFSQKAKSMKPIKLLRKLEHFFTRFDEIVEYYKLEKIKTIGDAYMALAGVNENNPEPILRTCLAAIEMRNFVRNERVLAEATGKPYWEIRIGIHAGPLVAGIIGTKRFSFDVWGDTVNIAARAQQMAEIDHINITSPLIQEIQDYFVINELGNLDIHKRGGTVEMGQLLNLKNEFSLFGRGIYPNRDLREKCNIENFDFVHMRQQILNHLKANLSDELLFHDINHSLNVEKAVIRIGQLEGVTHEELMLMRTAALFHSVGYVYQYSNNKVLATKFTQKKLPELGYTDKQVNQISSMILATDPAIGPKNLLEEIVCDADSDHIGRPDYFSVIHRLRSEMENFDQIYSDEEWMSLQINYLENDHQFYTNAARNLRNKGKINRISELKHKLEEATVNKPLE